MNDKFNVSLCCINVNLWKTIIQNLTSSLMTEAMLNIKSILNSFYYNPTKRPQNDLIMDWIIYQFIKMIH